MRDDARLGEKLVEASAPGEGVAPNNESVGSKRPQVALDDARHGRSFDDGKLVFASLVPDLERPRQMTMLPL